MKKTTKRRAAEPSAASLRAVPELDFSKAVVLGRGAAGLRRARSLLKARRGRPRQGTSPAGSSPRSVRFTDQMWLELERRARRAAYAPRVSLSDASAVGDHRRAA